MQVIAASCGFRRPTTLSIPSGWLPGGMSLRRYVGNNPLALADLLGLSPGYLSRVWGNMVDTNVAIPGTVAPWGLGALLRVGGTIIAELGTITIVAWVTQSFGAAALGGAAILHAGEVAILVVVTHALGTAAASAAFEGGVVIGSLVSEAPVVGVGTVGDFWGETLFDAYQDLLDAIGCWLGW